MRLIPLIIISFILSGCLSGGGDDLISWEKKFKPTNETEVFMPYTGKTICTQDSDLNMWNDIKLHVSNGYASIGFSVVGSINYNLGSAQSVAELKKFGEKIGADRISYGILKETNYGMKTSGSFDSNGSFNSTTRARVVTMWAANYWRKSKPDIFHIEARFRDLTEDEARKVGKHGGAVFLIVVRGGPAYLADIFEEDIATELDGDKIVDSRDLRAKLKNKGGSDILLTIIRDNVVLKKQVKLNP